jgi:hypothetical protein
VVSLNIGKLRRIQTTQKITFEDAIEFRLPDLQHSEAERFANFLRSILVYSPDERPTGVDILEHEWLKS